MSTQEGFLRWEVRALLTGGLKSGQPPLTRVAQDRESQAKQRREGVSAGEQCDLQQGKKDIHAREWADVECPTERWSYSSESTWLWREWPRIRH